jgi:hypothetical protein
MPRTSTTKTKKIEPAEAVPTKIDIKLDEHGDEIIATEEKEPADPLLGATIEEADEDAAIDDEELNPFGDKWEI